MKRGVVIACEAGADQARAEDLEIAHAPLQRLTRLRRFGFEEIHGTGTDEST